MSRWAEFGFPDHLEGAPIQTALEGIFYAIAERIHAGGTTPPVLPDIWSIPNFARDLEDYIFYRFDNYYLPDGTPFSRTAALEYLGEDLITIYGTLEDPFPRMSIDWLLQQYRILNLMYQLHTSTLRYYLSGWGSGSDWSETDSNFDSSVEEFEAYYYQEWKMGAWGYPHQRRVLYPTRIKYACTIAGDCVFSFNAYKESWMTFDSFGTGVTEGVNTVVFPSPADVAVGDTVYYPDGLSTFQRLSRITPSEPRGFWTENQKIWYDIRRGLEFYDDISQEG